MKTATSNLMLHCGGEIVTRHALDKIETPPAEGRWHPVSHAKVLDTVLSTLSGAGYTVKEQKLGVARNGHRFFGTLDLNTPLTPDGGVCLAVGIRNSTDKSFPLGFAGGNRVFVCDNLSFHSDLMVKRKHTLHGHKSFSDTIAEAIQGLDTFREAETCRISRLKATVLSKGEADSVIIEALEKEIISTRYITRLLREWRNPTFDYGTGTEPTAWRLFNSFTTVLGGLAVSNPTEYAGATMRLNGLLASAEPQLAAAV